MSLETKQAVTEVQNPQGREVLVSVRDLYVWFELRRWGFSHAGYVKAVDGVNFDLHVGESIAVVGESGCGKSSLMRAILGLNKPTKGSIIFQGQDLATMSGSEMRAYHNTKVGYVQQDPFGALPPFMSIQRILEEPLIVGGVRDASERQARVQKAMEEVKLSPVKDFLPKFPHMLSGGQQQRVVIARAMIMEPRLLIADEPVSMLDASVRVEILKLLRGIQERHNLSVMYITHDLSTVSYFSERIFVMYAGNLIEKSKVQGLLQNPGHPYTKALLTGTSEPDASNARTFKELPPGEPPSLVNPPTGCRFHPRCSYFMEGKCDIEKPLEFVVEPAHEVSCWLHEAK